VEFRLITDLEEMPGAPEGVVCWTGTMAGPWPVPVNVLLQDHQPPASLDAAFIDRICAAPGRFLRIAADAADLDGDVLGWAPAITFRAGQAWDVRFTEAPGELGVLVVFEGERVTEIDDLTAWV
jgi:hypothetical protein